MLLSFSDSLSGLFCALLGVYLFSPPLTQSYMFSSAFFYILSLALTIKIYEDNAGGRLSDERFDILSQSYEAEQKQLEVEVISLRQEIEVQARQSENIEKFIQTAQKYVSIETLNPYALRELVQAVYVEAPDKSSGKRRQNIHIKYDGLGFIPLDELTKGETA